jgi:hypothetical protein
MYAGEGVFFKVGRLGVGALRRDDLLWKGVEDVLKEVGVDGCGYLIIAPPLVKVLKLVHRIFDFLPKKRRIPGQFIKPQSPSQKLNFDNASRPPFRLPDTFA